MTRATPLCFAALLLLCTASIARGQLSKPIADNANVESASNKYLMRSATGDKPTEIMDEVQSGACPQNIALKWHTELGSSIYATPLITDLYSDGRKDIIVPGFVHNLEVVEGREGGRLAGFQAYFKGSLHASPLLYDMDFDGIQDIVVSTYDGEILFFKDTGELVGPRLTIPRLRVRRDWFVGLAPDHVDHSNPDVGAGTGEAGSGGGGSGGGSGSIPKPRGGSMQHVRGSGSGDPLVQSIFSTDEQKVAEKAGTARRRRQLLQEGGEAAGAQQAEQAVQQQYVEAQHAEQAQEQQVGQQVEQQAEQQHAQQQQAEAGGGQALGAEPRQRLTEEAAETFGELFGEDDGGGGAGGTQAQQGAAHGGDHAAGLQHQGGVDGDPQGVHHQRPLPHEHEHDDDYDHDRFHYNLEETDDDFLWDDELRRHHDETTGAAGVSPYVYVDAHIMATPAIGDLDGDGVDELVVAVSYFFDQDYYAQEDRLSELGRDIDIGKYIASGVVVFDLHRRYIKWSQHLDLSTDYTAYKAYAYSAPTLVDLDMDGKLEIVMGTSVGFLYVLDHQGHTVDGWPVQMGEIQAQVAVGDVNGDGAVELVVGDARGNVAAFDQRGIEVWERHVGSQINQAVTFGDVNGDGRLEVVVGTFNGKIYVLDGSTGKDVAPFPFQARGKIMAPILLTKLQAKEQHRGMQLAVVAFDGLLYVVDGITGCADTVDIGETSYAMVLADDLDGNGKLDLLVSTMNGNLYCIATAAKHHPLKTWPAQVPGGNMFTARWDWEGVYATAATRIPRDVRGQTLPVKLVVLDKRPPLSNATLPPGSPLEGLSRGRAPYRISVLLQGVGVTEMNAGDQPVIGMADVLNKTGTVTVEIPCPRSRSTATIRIEMRDAHRIAFYDEFSVSFHMHFYRLLKWLIAVPFLFSTVALLTVKAGPALPA